MYYKHFPPFIMLWNFFIIIIWSSNTSSFHHHFFSFLSLRILYIDCYWSGFFIILDSLLLHLCLRLLIIIIICIDKRLTKAVTFLLWLKVFKVRFIWSSILFLFMLL